MDSSVPAHVKAEPTATHVEDVKQMMDVVHEVAGHEETPPLEEEVTEHKETPSEESSSSNNNNNSGGKTPAWNPHDYMVMVKPEYLLPPAKAPLPPPSSSREQGQEQGKQQGKKRPRDARPDGLQKLCGQTRKGEVCSYGEACRFRCVTDSHLTCAHAALTHAHTTCVTR